MNSPTPHSTWNYSDALYLVSILKNVFSSSEKNINYITKSHLHMSMAQHLLNDAGIESEMKQVLLNGTPIGVVLDCAGEWWGPMGMNGIERTAYFTEEKLNSPTVTTQPIEPAALKDLQEHFEEVANFRGLQKKSVIYDDLRLLTFTEKTKPQETPSLIKYCMVYQINGIEIETNTLEKQLEEKSTVFDITVEEPKLTPIQNTQEWIEKKMNAVTSEMASSSEYLKSYDESGYDQDEAELAYAFSEHPYCIYIWNEIKKIKQNVNILFQNPTEEFLITPLTNFKHDGVHTRLEVNLSTIEHQKQFIEMLDFSNLTGIIEQFGLEHCETHQKESFAIGIVVGNIVSKSNPFIINSGIIDKNNIAEFKSSSTVSLKDKRQGNLVYMKRVRFDKIPEVTDIHKVEAELLIKEKLNQHPPAKPQPFRF